MIALAFLLAACGQIVPTPNDFPTPPMTPIVEFPNYTATPTFEPIPQPILSDNMSDAESFLLLIKTELAAGDDVGIAEKTHYPIQVTLDGKKTTFTEQSEFATNLRAILTDKVINAVDAADENDLVRSVEGIRVGNGELWFNLFCMDAACTDKRFLITQINN